MKQTRKTEPTAPKNGITTKWRKPRNWVKIRQNQQVHDGWKKWSTRLDKNEQRKDQSNPGIETTDFKKTHFWVQYNI